MVKLRHWVRVVGHMVPKGIAKRALSASGVRGENKSVVKSVLYLFV